MIADNLKKREKEVVLPENGYFSIIFSDGSTIHEKECSWNDIAEYQIVEYLGNMRMVKLSKHPIKSITIAHRQSSITLLPKEGEQVYTSIRSMATTHANPKMNQQILGRIVGIVKNGKVVEEKYLNGTDVVGIKV